jgi:hypothetical protein
MNRPRLIHLLLIIVVLSAQGCRDGFNDRTGNYTSSSGAFSVWFPAEPIVKKERSPDKRTPITHAQAKYSGAIFSVTFADYDNDPATVVGHEDQVLQAAAKGAVRDCKKDTIVQKPILIQGVHGIAVKAESVAPRGSFAANLFLKRTRLYVLMVSGPETAMQDPSVERFFSSFKLEQ